MKKFNTFLYIFILISTVSQSQNWKLEKDANGIKVYTSDVNGSDIKMFKGIMQYKTSIASCVALLDDTPNFPSWLYEITSSRNLKRLNEKEGYNYMVYNVPWPLDDRDIITRYTGSQDANKIVTLVLKSSGGYSPENSGLIRVYILNGHWKFKPLGNGVLEIEYVMHMEPNGSIPSWLANTTVVDAPYNTLLKMKTELLKPKYQKAQYPWILE